MLLRVRLFILGLRALKSGECLESLWTIRKAAGQCDGVRREGHRLIREEPVANAQKRLLHKLCDHRAGGYRACDVGPKPQSWLPKQANTTSRTMRCQRYIG